MDLSGQNRRTQVRKKGTPVGSRIAAFLRARHPVKTAAHVAAASGIDPETVQRLLARGSVPEGLNMWRLERAEQAARAAFEELERARGQS